jgi:hypothetical protein
MQLQFGLIAGNTSSPITGLKVDLTNANESTYFHYIKKSPETLTDLSTIYWDVPLKTYLNYGLSACQIVDKPVKLFSIIPSNNAYNIYKFANYGAVRRVNEREY